jgi:thiol-disulfide isomerase/thioredoxin
MSEGRGKKAMATGPVRALCLALGIASVLGCYWGIGIVLGPVAFLLANWLSSREGHLTSDIGGIAGLVGFAASLAVVVPRGGNPFEETHPWIGEQAPDFELVDIKGATHRLSDYRGKRVFVMQWGIRCPPCIHEIPHLISLVEQIPPDDFQIVSVSADPEKWLSDVAANTGINYPVVSLATPGNGWGEPYNLIEFLPTLLVVSPEGIFEEVYAGGLSKENLRSLAQGEPLSRNP